MTELREHSGVLVVVRCWCGIQHGIPESLRNEALRGRGRGTVKVWCPLGHSWHYTGESEADQLRRALVARGAVLDRVRADRDQAKRSLAAQKGVTTRIKRRVANGVCPCCKRTFQDLARHMAGQHPGYAEATDGE
jgi:hypothetical protein